jgi:hypothetical protein
VEQRFGDAVIGYHGFALRLQRSLQNFTCSQSRSHFLRHANGRWQAGQILVGRCCFLTPCIAGSKRCIGVFGLPRSDMGIAQR